MWVTFLAFALAPLMGGGFMLIVRNSAALAKAGSLNSKIQMMQVTADWNSYFGILTQAVGVGGILIFGFVASWILGRDYSEGTAKDLLSLPVSRVMIVNAKLIVEMTNSHNVIFYILVSALFSNLISTVVVRHSFYDQLKEQYLKEIHSTETQLLN